MKTRKILYIGSFVDKRSLSGIPNVAGNMYEEKLLELFDNSILFDTINVLSLRPFKSNFSLSSLKIKTENSIKKGKSIRIDYIPLINFTGLKYLFSFIYIFIYLIRWNLNNTKFDKYVVVYNPFTHRVIPCLINGFLFKQKSILIIADLPIGSIAKDSNLIRKYIYYFQLKTLKWFNNFILITESIKTDFNLKNKNTLIYEGHITNEFIQFDTISQYVSNEKFLIIYAGSLERGSGIDFLLQLLDKMATLPIFDLVSIQIYGDGYYKNDILVKEKLNKIISYKGNIDKKELFNMYRKANVLILPRDPDDVLTKYTFPSKLFEYIFFGKTVVSNNLNGIPYEYLNYLTIPHDKSINSWVNTFKFLIDDSTNKKKYDNTGRDFLLQKKTIDCFLLGFKKFTLNVR